MREGTHTITAEELLRMPDDGFQYELVAGRLKRMSPPGWEHGEVAGRLYLAVASYVEAHGLGVTVVGDPGFTLARDPDTVRGPDIAFVTRDRIAAVGRPKGYWPGAPDLAAEVVSPGDTRAEIAEKITDYFNAGAREVWIVDPRRRTVTIHRPATRHVLAEHDMLKSDELLPGFELPVAKLWGG